MTENLLESKVNLAAKKFAEDPVALTTMETDIENNSHLLFTTFPVDHNRDISTLRVATQHIHDIIKNAISNIDAARQISFYFKASGHPYFRGTFGYVFEKFFYVWLSSNPDNGLICTPALPSGSGSTDVEPEQLCIEPVGWDKVIVHGGEAGAKGYKAANKYGIPFCWIPASRSDPTFDAVLCTDAHIVTIQVTVAAKHSVEEKGFERLKKYLPKKFQERSWHHVFVTDRPDTADALRRKKYSVTEKRNIKVHTAVLNIQLFNFSHEVLNRAKAPSVSRHELLYIHSGTNRSHQGESDGVDEIEMEIDAEGEEQVGVEYPLLSTGGTRLTKSGR
jgi:hypothetical protein